MAGKPDILLAERQGLTGGDLYLRTHQVHAGNALGHRMLNLDTGVHLDKIEFAVFIQKLERSCTKIANAPTGFCAYLADARALFGRDSGRRRLLNDFLMATLHGALALAQMHRVAVAVGQHLNFNMARIDRKSTRLNSSHVAIS